MSELHSPGPWVIDWTIAGGPQTHEAYPELHYANIHSPRYYNTAPYGLSVTGYMHKADIYLLAAAPDLLALARQLASECAHCNGTGIVERQIGGDGYGGRCAAIADVESPCPDCHDIRAVIAKALGRS